MSGRLRARRTLSAHDSISVTENGYATPGSTGRCGWESLLESVTLGNVTMSHRTRERSAECLASLPLNYDRSAARSTREYYA
ncbi:hypothetical protein EVAR_91366_1 [Eumeta japonica]|uniref:Uncharacterized protein n=1 Tax=Eumeta variegata TaxID=151549 RepID=A0A4C1T876_EUMVA|nr:hypothetical protein EVAR_91366_1 [Eumeta japonica]